MTDRIHHVILTRSAYDPAHFPAEFISRREELFNLICKPSIEGQTDKRFSWVIGMNEKDRRLYSGETPDKTGGVVMKKVVRKTWVSRVKREIPRGATHLLMTRFDDDDAVSLDFVSRLRQRADSLVASGCARKKSFILTFPVGYVIHKDSVRALTEPLNQFVSLLSPVEEASWIYDHWPSQVPAFGEVVTVDEEPAWVWFRHKNAQSRWEMNVGRSVPVESFQRSRFSLPEAARMERLCGDDKDLWVPANRVQFLNRVRDLMGYRSYLEIGCAADATFRRIRAPRKVGVDPDRGGTHRMTSDEFFKDNTETFDLIFVDGLHDKNQVLRDVDNALRCVSSTGLIVVHDCLPKTKAQQLPYKAFRAEAERAPDPRHPHAWCGNVWKAIVRLREREDIDTAVWDAEWGLAVIVPRRNGAVLHDAPRELEWQDFQRDKKRLLRLMNWSEIQHFLNGGPEGLKDRHSLPAGVSVSG